MHHVTARSIAAEHIFRDSGDNVTGIRILSELVSDGFLVCHAFCFMPTHYHLFATFTNVSTVIHKLNRRYAVAFNRRHRRRGHVFDSPFSRTEVTTSGVGQLARYIALNPPDHERWPYASYPALIGTPTGLLVRRPGPDPRDVRERRRLP